MKYIIIEFCATQPVGAPIDVVHADHVISGGQEAFDDVVRGGQSGREADSC